jgi:colicin import membrane protein
MKALPMEPPARRRGLDIGIGTVLAALLLHALLVAALVIDWQAAPTPEARPIAVRLVEEPPPPPPPPTPPPKPEPPKPEPPKPPPPPPPPPEPPKPPPEIKPRESGADEKTEAEKKDKPEANLPASLPKPIEIPPPEIKPEPTPPEPTPAPKPTPPRSTARATASGKGEVKPVERLPALPKPTVSPPMRSLTVRLPSPGGGTGERDLAGDAYLNRLLRVLESHRVYPPAAEFAGASARTVMFEVVIEPTGQLSTITNIGSTGSPRLDEAARMMITNSAPFPPLPSDYPQIRTPITIIVPIYPRG